MVNELSKRETAVEIFLLRTAKNVKYKTNLMSGYNNSMFKTIKIQIICKAHKNNVLYIIVMPKKYIPNET